MRVARSILTLAAQEAFTVITVLVGVVATPLLLRWLGDTRFGAFEAATDWYGYVSLFEFGITGALYPLLSRSMAGGNGGRTYKIMVAGIRAYAVSAAVMVLVGVLVASFITRLVPVGAAYARDLQAGAWIAIAGLVLLPFSGFRALAEAAQRGYLASALLIAQSVLITALALLLAWQGWGIAGQFLAVLIGMVFFSAVLAWQGTRRFPGIWTAALNRSGDREIARELSQLNWPSFMFNVCGRVNFMTDNIIVARLLSPAAVVPFFVTQRLATLAQRELQGVGNSCWAGLAELHHHGLHVTFNQRLVELTRLISILAVAGLVPISVYNARFVTLWVGAPRYGGTAVTCLAAVNALLLAVFSLWGWCINGLGEVRKIMPGLTAQTAINLICSVAFTFVFGIVGPLLGTTVAFTTVTIWYLPWLLNKLYGTDLRELIKAVAVPAATAIPYVLGVGWFSAQQIVGGWLGLALEMSVSALVYIGFSWVFLLKSAEKELWVQRFRLIVQPSGQ